MLHVNKIDGFNLSKNGLGRRFCV